MSQGPSPISESSEEGRALLQARVALFWKVIFCIMLFGSGLGAVGAVTRPGADFVITLVATTQAGIFWWLSRRGDRSIRFSRTMESAGLLLNATFGAVLGRYILAGFARDHAIASAEGMVMADAFVAMLQMAPMSMLLAVRAALIPSRPRRTIVVSALFGVPMILATAVLIPTADGGLAWRPLDSGIYPWLPTTNVIIWFISIATCTVISWVIYGLRAEVREARKFGQYVLERKLGEGGMGEVYRARHGMMRRPSAVKLLRGDQAGEANLRRFEREVQLTARLTHPNTITIFDYGRTHDGVFYYAMELLDGATLQRIVAIDGAQPAGRVVRILRMVCGALSEAHAIGLIHRDIKPANIMLCTQGGERDVVKLLDFGLVKEFEVDRNVQLTGASAVVSTPQYMAPESIRAPDSVDARADIYALGAVAYYLLAGSDVFNGKTVVEICAQHLHQKPESLSARGVVAPTDLEAVVMSCLEKDPAHRPQSAADLRSRVEACAVEPWDSARALTWWRTRQSHLEADSAPSTGAPRTMAVDAARRSATELATGFVNS